MKSKVWFGKLASGDSEETAGNLAAKTAVKAGLAEVVGDGGLIGILQHVGEGENVGHVKPPVTAALADRIKKLNGKPFLTGSSALYSGSRNNACDHMLQAYAHGFGPEAIGCPIIMCDGLIGSDRVPIEPQGARRCRRAYLGSAIAFMRGLVVVTHPTGHILSGYAGAIKNVSMGLSSRGGKLAMHHGGRPEFTASRCTACGTCARWCPEGSIAVQKIAEVDVKKCVGCGQCFTVCPDGAIEFRWAKSGLEFQERLVDYAAAVKAQLGDRICLLNVIRHFQKECDCMGVRQKPICQDVGVVASRDIVAIEQATVDLLNKQAGRDLVLEAGGRDYNGMLAYAEKMGLGVRGYDLAEVR